MDFRKEALEIIRDKTSIVFAGGGTLGVAAVGALEKLEENGLDLKQIRSVSGSSVGSILATALTCGADVKYMKNKLDSIDFQKLMNKKCFLVQGINLIKDYGLHDMSEVRNFVVSVFTDLGFNPDITFKELFEKTGVWLTITYLSMNYGRTIFADHIYEPTSSVRETIIKSSAIPIFYEAYFEGYGKDRQVSVDGGTIDLYPFRAERYKNIPLHEIIGLKFVSSEEKEFTDEGQPGTIDENKGAPSNIISYLENLFDIIRNQAMKLHVKNSDWLNTVKINVGNFSSTDFNLTQSQKDWLFEQGEKAIEDYIQELSDNLRDGKYVF